MAKLKRFISNEKNTKVFDAVKDSLRGLAREIKASNKVKDELARGKNQGEIYKWNMQWRPDNKIFLYYKGVSLRVKLNAASKKDCFRLEVSKSIKKRAEENGERFFENSYSLAEMNQTVIAAMKWFEAEISNFKGPARQKERREEQAIAGALETNMDFLIIDMEVVVGGLKEKPEGDLLALAKNGNGSYSFVPIELKIAGQDCSTARMQVDKFAEIIAKESKRFKENYQEVYAQKRAVGIIDDGPKEIEITGLGEYALVVILNENGIYSSKHVMGEFAPIKELHITREEFISLKWLAK